ncbi:uncharacterized protein NDAI_0J00100 [Naumovozyma dairenensis CBS 421]|uniref:Lysophospholipase n=1 Tax=Naumovozyma dairenensis (strain ATCC 10597 / BCRC 20456 / CBS 421 / NBRC 0211 / NRRL Y-12639) TaxID=1071378 RepID=G0WHC2_NAUDC|nr:hypothetical protein NDAI_0J00100 [Naumovozyma dairenensis CBS 421]CCD26902.1 hypothetical protein NDAI_0J00100 [Naumovozyma dairenensis CBS 421]
MQLQNLLLAVVIASRNVEAWSPSNSYAPANVTCSDDINLLREASDLSQDEKDWLKKRDSITTESLKAFLEKSTRNFSDTSLLNQLFGDNSTNVPKIGIACSGGGYRAMLSGAGMLAAMDNRTDGANEYGLGGILQSSTYLSGLSGGNWLTGTLAWNNWTSVQDIINNMTVNNSIWDITNSIFSTTSMQNSSDGSVWDQIAEDVKAKQDAGFNISLADIWGRALAYNFFPDLHHGGDAYTWSTLRDSDVFKNGGMPFPISVADGRYPGTTVINLNATVFEFNPFEMGSWDPTLNTFTDVKYLGTKGNGIALKRVAEVPITKPALSKPAIHWPSVTGLPLETLSSSILPQSLSTLGVDFLSDVTDTYNDIALYSPNPFKDAAFIKGNHSKSIVNSPDLFLVDGGEDGQGVPLVPLLKQNRGLDVVFALDSSSDTNSNWPDGTSLTKTYDRQFTSQGEGMAFPYVPDQDTFISEGLNMRPTFFGCDAANLTDLEYIPPLVIYIPSARHSFNANTSTLQLSYTPAQRLSKIQNGFESTTRGNFTDDENFLGCVGCAIMRRKQESLNETLPSECNQCFADYCWDYKVANSGVTNTTGTTNATLSSNTSLALINRNSTSSVIAPSSTSVVANNVSQTATSSTSASSNAAISNIQNSKPVAFMITLFSIVFPLL